MYAIGGLLKHAPPLCAFANPTTNSYKRLVAGLRGPDQALLQPPQPRGGRSGSRSTSPSPKSRRIEYRCPDSAANPYLLFSAMLMAALDGIQNKIRPGDPLDKDIYDLQPEELADVPATPRSLEASLDALRADHDFLLRGDVFTPDVIDTWIWYKQTHEVEALRDPAPPLRVHAVLRRVIAATSACEEKSSGRERCWAVPCILLLAIRHRDSASGHSHPAPDRDRQTRETEKDHSGR